MTLTVTVAADGLIVQTSDHRLSTDRGSVPVSNSEPKQMYALADDWAAVVGFAGQGYVQTRLGSITRASDIAYDAVTEAGRTARFADVAETMAARATRWLRPVRGDRRHTFVMAGMVVQSPEVVTRVAVVSNWQRPVLGADGVVSTEVLPGDGQFKVTLLDVDEPIVFAMGCHEAVRRDELLRVRLMVSNNKTTRQLARAMAYINGAASQRQQAVNAVSRHCTSVALLLSRLQINGAATAYTDAGEEPVPVLMGNAGTREMLARGIAQLQAQGELPPGLLAPPRSSTFAKGIAGLEFRDLRHATPADPLWPKDQ